MREELTQAEILVLLNLVQQRADFARFRLLEISKGRYKRREVLAEKWAGVLVQAEEIMRKLVPGSLPGL